MAVFSVEIADVDVARVLAAVANNYHRPDQVNNPAYDPDVTIANPNFDPAQPDSPENPSVIPDPSQLQRIDNPENLAKFANRIVRQFLSEHVQSYETNLAREQALAGLSPSVVISDPTP